MPFESHGFSYDAFAEARITFPKSVRNSVPKRQAEFLHGWRAARAALCALEITDLEICIGSHREPVWPSGVHGNISHSAQLAVAIAMLAASVRGVGTDVEPTEPAPAGLTCAATWSMLQRWLY